MEKSSHKAQKAGLGYTIGNYLLRGIGFLSIPIFSRIMSTEDFGVYNTYMAYEGILFIIIGLALHSSFKSAKVKYGNKLNEYVSSCTLLCLISLGFFLIAGNLFCFVTHYFDNLYISILAVHSFSAAVLTYYNTYVSLQYEYRKFLTVSAFNALGHIVLSIILILTVFSDNRAYGRIVGTAAPLLILSGILLVGFWRKGRPKANMHYWKYALTYSLPIVPHGISQVILASFDRIMISTMSGDAEAGIYSFAYNVYTIIAVTYSSLDSVWGPWFYEQMSAGNYMAIRSTARKYSWGIGIFTSGLLLVSPEIVTLLGTEAYHEAIYLTVPIIIGGFFSYLYSFPAQIEYYFEKTKYIAIGTSCAAIFNIAANYVGIRAFGYHAAAYTTLMTYALYFLFHYLISLKVCAEKIYDLKSFVILIFVVVIVGGVTQTAIRVVVLRWGMAVIAGIIFLFYMEKQFQVRKYIIFKTGRKD